MSLPAAEIIDVCVAVKRKNLRVEDAAKKAGVSVATIYRWYKVYKKQIAATLRGLDDAQGPATVQPTRAPEPVRAPEATAPVRAPADAPVRGRPVVSPNATELAQLREENEHLRAALTDAVLAVQRMKGQLNNNNG